MCEREREKKTICLNITKAGRSGRLKHVFGAHMSFEEEKKVVRQNIKNLIR